MGIQTPSSARERIVLLVSFGPAERLKAEKLLYMGKAGP